MAKIYYNDNGTWKVVDISGGGGGSSNVVESPLTIGTGLQTLKIHKSGYIEYTNPNQHMELNFPFFSAQGTADLLSSANVKTLFGNKSIVGTGNIDLYRHCVTFTPSDMSVGSGIRLVIYSSNNLKVDSLTDLKTLLGNTFEYPATGAFKLGSPLAFYVTAVTETGYRYYVSDDTDSTITPYPAGTWNDDVKTI